MPFDGSGNFNRVMNWQADAAAAIKIKADRHDQEDDNLAQGLSNVITKDGQTQPTANIPMNGKRLVNLGAPVNPTDAATRQFAESIRNFNTAITLSGAVPEARIGFTVADIGFGARAAGTPSGSLNRFVWNTEPDLSGTDIATLDDTGKLTLAAGGLVTTGPITITGSFTFNGATPIIKFVTADMSLKGGPNNIAITDKADGTGGNIFYLDDTGRQWNSGGFTLSGIQSGSVSKAFIAFQEIGRSIVARKAGTPSGSLARVVFNSNAEGTGTDLFDFDKALQEDKDSVLVNAGVTQTPRTTPDAPSGGNYTPTPVGGLLRQVNSVGTAWNFNAPTFAGNYTMIVLINNAAISGAVTFAGFNKVSGPPHATALGKMSLVYITKVGAAKTAFIEAL